MGQTNQSTVIDAPVDTVWSAIRDFHDMHWAPNVITQLDVVGDHRGHQPGARRVLNGVFHETLHELSDETKSFSYSIDDAPSPISRDDVSNYVGRVTVRAAPEGGTLVEWTSQWERNDDKGYEFCHPIYVALLTDMKQSLE